MIRLFNRENKNWTVLIYANGRNDLEPEITKALLDIESIGSGEDINIVIELGRASKKLVKTTRKKYNDELNIPDDWHGVRRYLLNKESSDNSKINSKLIENLGNVNMAKSTTLEEFITWGIDNFRAKRYALIILGHGSGYMGVIPDFCQGLPSIMTMYGLKRALENSMMTTNKSIDILLFDSCYMNTVEVIYEIASGKRRPKYIVTPELSPLDGLPYGDIISVLKKYKNKSSLKITKYIEEKVNNKIKNIHSKVYTYRLNKILFLALKGCINKVSKYVINNRSIIDKYINGDYKGKPFLKLYKLIDDFKDDDIGLKLNFGIWILKKILSFISINKGYKNSISIFLIDKKYYELTKDYYQRMTFNRNNTWIKVLSGENNELIYDDNNLVLQEDMSLNSIYYVISLQNPSLNKDDVYNIIDELGWLKSPKLEEKLEKDKEG